jgi:hypothetical protein
MGGLYFRIGAKKLRRSEAGSFPGLTGFSPPLAPPFTSLIRFSPRSRKWDEVASYLLRAVNENVTMVRSRSHRARATWR